MKLLLLLLLTSSCATFAATISVTPGSGGQDFKNSIGEILTNTSPHTIRVGYFSNYSQTGANDAPVVSEAFRSLLADSTPGIIATIASFFVPIGEGRTNLGNNFDWSITALSGSLSGKYSVNATLNSTSLTFSSDPANSISANGVPRGSRLFILAYNAEDYTTATEIGIFSGASATAGQWYVPTSSVTSMTLNLSNIDTDNEVFRGSRGSLVLAPIPEPGISLLAAASLAVGFRRRRR